MVTHEEILQAATLAKLYVSEEELDSLTEEMDKMIAFANTISEASAEITDFDNINSLSNVFRCDEVKSSISQDEVLQNAPCQANGCFLVKKHS